MLQITLMLASFAPGQTLPPTLSVLPEPIRMETRKLELPFAFPPGQPEVKGVILFVSRDDGKTWSEYATVLSEKKKTGFFGVSDKKPDGIEFVAPADGIYSFSTQVLMKDGTKSPAETQKLTVQMRALVDTSKKGK